MCGQSTDIVNLAGGDDESQSKLLQFTSTCPGSSGSAGSATAAVGPDLIRRAGLDPGQQAGEFRRSETDLALHRTTSTIRPGEGHDYFSVLRNIQFRPGWLAPSTQCQCPPVEPDIRSESNAEQSVERDVRIRIANGTISPRLVPGFASEDRGGVMTDKNKPIHNGRDHRGEHEQDDDTEYDLDGSRQSAQLLPVVAAVATVGPCEARRLPSQLRGGDPERRRPRQRRRQHPREPSQQQRDRSNPTIPLPLRECSPCWR